MTSAPFSNHMCFRKNLANNKKDETFFEAHWRIYLSFSWVTFWRIKDSGPKSAHFGRSRVARYSNGFYVLEYHFNIRVVYFNLISILEYFWFLSTTRAQVLSTRKSSIEMILETFNWMQLLEVRDSRLETRLTCKVLHDSSIISICE